MGTKLDRKDVKIFAENSDATLITEFRTESADGSTASFSRDPDVIQNANYEQGWVENQNNLNTKIFGEDMNAVSYVQSYLLKYLYENGIPEWSATTEYFEHSIARVDDKLFISLTDNNINNDPTNTVGEWSEIPLSAINIVTSGTGSSIFNTSSGNNITLKSLSVDGYASLQDNGDQINIHVLGGSGIVDAYWGQIRGTLTNQTDLVTALGDKQDNLTFDTPLSKDVNNEVSIPKANTTTDGYISSTDWNTFNGKQDELSGLTHNYTSGTDTVELYPTATNSNIGTNTYPITNVNASNVNASTVNSGALFNLNGDISIRCQDGDSVEIGTNGSGASKRLEVSTDGVTANGDLSITGTASTDKIQGKTTATTMQTGASIVPDTDNTYDLGSASSKCYANTYTNKVVTNQVDTLSDDIDLTLNDDTSVQGHLNLLYDLRLNQGRRISFRSGSTEVGYIDITGSQTIRINANNGTSTLGLSGSGSTVETNSNFIPTSGVTGISVGLSNRKWANVYANDLYGTTHGGCDRKNKDDIQERGTDKGGKSSLLDKVNSLKTYTYTFKNDESKRTHLGIMAQDIREVEPLLVTNASEKKDEEDLYVDIMGYCTLLTEAVKELSAKVEGLETRVKELESNKEGFKK